MTASHAYSTIVSTTIKQEGGVFVATSSTLKGLLVVSKDKAELEKTLIPQAIADLYRACGVEMFVNQVDPKSEKEQWVATPVAALKISAEPHPAC